jgi:hypothetical protein
MTGYGFGFYRYGLWFGFGQIRFRRWAVDLCLFTHLWDQYPENGYIKYWFTVGK